MPYQTRQKTVTWKSNSGEKFMLEFVKDGEYSRKHTGQVRENVTKTAKGAKTRRKIVGNSDDTFQDLGVSGRDIPLTIQFNGENHDIEADRFEQALCEIGKSKLQLHYGNEINVQVMDFKRSWSIIRDVATTVFSVNFHEIGQTKYPISETQKKESVANAANASSVSNAENLAEVVQETGGAAILDKLQANLDIISANLSGDVVFQRIMADIKGQLVNGVATLSVYTIGMQVYKLVKTGQSLASNARGMIDRARDILYNLQVYRPSREVLIANDFVAKTTLLAASENLFNHNYLTRKEAIDTAEGLQDAYTGYKEWFDEKQQNFSELDNAIIETTDISNIIQNAAGLLTENSYELKVEKIIVLSETSNLIELAYLYYRENFTQNPDETIGYIASTNNFGGDDLIELPAGREVLIYV